MKISIPAFFLFLLFIVSGCSDYTPDLHIDQCDDNVVVNSDFSKASRINEVLQKIVHNGVPGASLAIYSEEGWWTTAAGFASIEKQTPMLTCHLQYLQSIAKTYMAVAILRLHEEGRIELDAPITQYLPHDISGKIANAEKITVRMLLNHTSGIPEYNADPAYISYLLQHPDHVFEPREYLEYIRKKPLNFTPGSKYAYRNTNYLLLALMADEITGDHSQYIDKVIFKPLNLQHTFYRNDAGYLRYPTLVNSYWDRYSNGIIENVSEMQRNNVRSLIGDDGIVATPVDAVKFLVGLEEGKLLSAASLALMKTWVNDEKGNPSYGLGLDHETFEGEVAYGHSGGGLGSGCLLYYFPSKRMCVFVVINLGTITESPIHKKVEPLLDELYRVLVE